MPPISVNVGETLFQGVGLRRSGDKGNLASSSAPRDLNPMPSVDVVWKGNCPNAQIRYRLLGYLHRLAAVSDEYLRLRQPDRPLVLTALNEQRRQPPPLRANIETVDRPVSGQVLVSSRISPNPDILATRAREAGLSVADDPAGEGPALIRIESGRLRGLDFKLFDPRGLYPGVDRMSFVFLECPELPFLDGRLVEEGMCESREAAPTAPVRPAGLYLSSPSIHLRYYLEDWTDCLFSWIRFFFIGDLWWHRWEELQGYDDYRGVFEEMQTERGGAAAEAATFDAVLATFRQHAEHWIGEVETWAAAEKGNA
jgi:hypothetical protein